MVDCTGSVGGKKSNPVESNKSTGSSKKSSTGNQSPVKENHATEGHVTQGSHLSDQDELTATYKHNAEELIELLSKTHNFNKEQAWAHMDAFFRDNRKNFNKAESFRLYTAVRIELQQYVDKCEEKK